MEQGLRVRTVLLLCIFFSSVTFTYTQELMKIGDVFDFEVGDRFHYRSELVPPNADRVEIIEKYYSTENDTVYYVRFHDRYASEVVWFPDPHLEYTFWTEIDTMLYVMLDSSISYYQWWASYDTNMFSYDTLIYISEDFCDSLINGYEYATSSFEPDVFRVEYGKGLGQVRFWYSSGSGSPPGVQADYGLFYYQKQGFDCGVPDTLTVSISDQLNVKPIIFTYPNPFTSHTTIEYNLTEPSYVQISIYNAIGEQVYQAEDRPMYVGKHTYTWTADHLPKGLYYAVLRNENGVSVVKMVKQ